MLSFGTDSALALAIASRSRGFIAGSGAPCLAAMVMSRESLENSFERSLSCRSLRNWMFLYFEWPAIGGLLPPWDRRRKRADLDALDAAARQQVERVLRRFQAPCRLQVEAEIEPAQHPAS